MKHISSTEFWMSTKRLHKILILCYCRVIILQPENSMLSYLHSNDTTFSSDLPLVTCWMIHNLLWRWSSDVEDTEGHNTKRKGLFQVTMIEIEDDKSPSAHTPVGYARIVKHLKSGKMSRKVKFGFGFLKKKVVKITILDSET